MKKIALAALVAFLPLFSAVAQTVGPGPVPCAYTACTVTTFTATSTITFSASASNSNTNGYQLRNQNASGTAPTLLPDKTSTTTGLGSSGAGLLDLIASGNDIMRMTSTGPVFVTIPADTASVDASVCRDTTSGAAKTGTGALGICLGTSTERFKRNITVMHDSLAGIMKLKLMNFRYKSGHGYDPNKYQNGLLVEDVAKVFPDCIGLGPDKKPLNLDGFCIFFHSLKGQQEQQIQIATLTKRIEAIERRLH